MSDRVRRILSHESGPFWQFVKYGIIGVLSTAVQAVAFYVLAATVLKCLDPGDVAVRLFGLPATSVSETVRALRFAAATALAFVVSNVFCWLLNRAFVFRAGRYRWWTELAFFVLVSATAMALATVLSSVLIARFGLMTTVAVVLEVVVSFLFNFFFRKFFIFKG